MPYIIPTVPFNIQEQTIPDATPSTDGVMPAADSDTVADIRAAGGGDAITSLSENDSQRPVPYVDGYLTIGPTPVYLNLLSINDNEGAPNPAILLSVSVHVFGFVSDGSQLFEIVLSGSYAGDGYGNFTQFANEQITTPKLFGAPAWTVTQVQPGGGTVPTVLLDPGSVASDFQINWKIYSEIRSAP